MSAPVKGGLAGAIDWAFRDRTTGHITIAQAPNLPLWLFLAATALAWLIGGSGPVVYWLGIAGRLALAWWALDEVLRGVNPWRRFLGGATLAGLVAILLAYTSSH